MADNKPKVMTIDQLEAENAKSEDEGSEYLSAQEVLDYIEEICVVQDRDNVEKVFVIGELIRYYYTQEREKINEN